MGCVSSSPEQLAHTNGSTAQPRRANEKALVLIGQGESGKSTIFKQMKIINGTEQGSEGFTRAQRVAVRELIFENAVSQMQVLLEVHQEEEMEWQSPEIAELAKQFMNTKMEDLDPAAPQTRDILKRLWEDRSLKVIFEERDRLFNINDGVKHFWDKLDALYAPDYVPTDDDILRVRVRTIGFDEATFQYKGTTFKVTDIGGQRSERRKWSVAIEDASCILFVCAMCEWDQRLRESPDQSRMTESFSLFRDVLEVVGDHGRQSTILLLNKLDLFKEKMKTERKANFKKYFPKYDGPLDWEPCANYLKAQFREIIGKREIYIHTIVATETNNVHLVWQDIRNVMIKQNVQDMDVMS